jgi:hypothetical protein
MVHFIAPMVQINQLQCKLDSVQSENKALKNEVDALKAYHENQVFATEQRYNSFNLSFFA